MKLKTGRIVMGSVTGIESYGVFINIDEYYNGLIHISEISDDYVRNINDYVNVGEKIYVKVIDVDNRSNRLRLSIKDIDYKIDKRDREDINETIHGFNTLGKNLPLWVDSKMKELENRDNA